MSSQQDWHVDSLVDGVTSSDPPVAAAPAPAPVAGILEAAAPATDDATVKWIKQAIGAIGPEVVYQTFAADPIWTKIKNIQAAPGLAAEELKDEGLFWKAKYVKPANDHLLPGQPPFPDVPASVVFNATKKTTGAKSIDIGVTHNVQLGCFIHCKACGKTEKAIKLPTVTGGLANYACAVCAAASKPSGIAKSKITPFALLDLGWQGVEEPLQPTAPAPPAVKIASPWEVLSKQPPPKQWKSIAAAQLADLQYLAHAAAPHLGASKIEVYPSPDSSALTFVATVPVQLQVTITSEEVQSLGSSFTAVDLLKTKLMKMQAMITELANKSAEQKSWSSLQTASPITAASWQAGTEVEYYNALQDKVAYEAQLKQKMELEKMLQTIDEYPVWPKLGLDDEQQEKKLQKLAAHTTEATKIEAAKAAAKKGELYT